MKDELNRFLGSFGSITRIKSSKMTNVESIERLRGVKILIGNSLP